MGQNDFKRTLQDLDESMEEKNLRQKANSAHDKGKEKEEKRVDVGVLDLGLIKEDPNKLYPVIYYALKVGCSLIKLIAERVERVGRVDGRKTRGYQTVRAGQDGCSGASVLRAKSQTTV